MLTTYEARTLLLLLPPLLALELTMLVLSAAQGWLRQKLAGYQWLLHHRGWLRDRRALVQGQWVVDDAGLARLLTPRLFTTVMPLPIGIPLLNALLTAWWTVARRMLRAPRPAQ